ncbi:MAG: aminoglycoside 6-adenylyltransferase [Acetatifactor sp.]|nr:aminoglycoside 6-adenylyltransferase [Acetatifactor sp.]
MCRLSMRPQLVKILSWKIGNETDFSVSVGKSAKYMYRWLEPTVWERFLQMLHRFFNMFN